MNQSKLNKLVKALEKKPFNEKMLETALRGVDSNKAAIMTNGGAIHHTPLTYVVSQGNIAVVKYLLDYNKGNIKVDPDAPCLTRKLNFELLSTPLHVVFFQMTNWWSKDEVTRQNTNLQMVNYLEIAELLLEHGATADAVTESSTHTPMMILLGKNALMDEHFRKAISLLVRYGADPERKCIAKSHSIVKRRLPKESQDAFMQKIREKNNNPNELPDMCDSFTHLQSAIIDVFPDKVKFFLELGAKVDVTLFGLDIIELALIVNNQEIIRLLRPYCKNLLMHEQKLDEPQSVSTGFNLDPDMITEFHLPYFFAHNLFSGHPPDAAFYSEEEREIRIRVARRLVEYEFYPIEFEKFGRFMSSEFYSDTFIFKTWDDLEGTYPGMLAQLLFKNNCEAFHHLVQVFWDRHYMRLLDGDRKISTMQAYKNFSRLIEWIRRQYKNRDEERLVLKVCADLLIFDNSDASLLLIEELLSDGKMHSLKNLMKQRLLKLLQKCMDVLENNNRPEDLPVLIKLVACQLPGLYLDSMELKLPDSVLKDLVDNPDLVAIHKKFEQIASFDKKTINKLVMISVHAREARDFLAVFSEEKEWGISYKQDYQQNIKVEFVAYPKLLTEKKQKEVQAELARKGIDGCFFEEEGAVIFEWTKPGKPQARPDTTVQVISKLSSASPVPSMPSISPLPPVEITPPRTTPKLKTRSAAPNLNAREKIPEPIEMQFEFKGTLKNGDTVTYCHPYRESKEEVTMEIFWMEEIKAFGAISPDVDDAFRNAKGIGIVIGERLSRELRVKMETGVVGDEGKPLKLVEDSERRKGIFNQSTALKVKWKGEFGTLRVPLEKVEVECSDGSKAVVYVARGFKWDKEREATKAEYFGELLQNRLSPRPI